MLQFISRLFGGSKSEKDVKQIQPVVAKINEWFQQYQGISNDELRGKTADFKARIKAHISDIDKEIAGKQAEADALAETAIHEKDAIYQEVDKLKKARDKKIEEVLEKILPEAFAVVKETARRFKENTQIVAQATELDRELSVTKLFSKIAGKLLVIPSLGTWCITMCS